MTEKLALDLEQPEQPEQPLEGQLTIYDIPVEQDQSEK